MSRRTFTTKQHQPDDRPSDWTALRMLKRAVKTGAPFVLLGASIIAVALAVLGILGSGAPRTAASGTGGGTGSSGGSAKNFAQVTPTCGFPGRPACPVATPAWYALRSTSAADIIAAARQSDLFSVNASGQGDTPSLARLGIPTLVLALHASGVGQGPDYYLIPIQDQTGATLGVVMCTVNASRTAIDVVDIVQYMHVRPAGQVTVISAQAATGDFTAQTHVALRVGTEPQLVYFPNSYTAVESGQSAWNAGGTSADDPVWLLAGADGVSRVVGTDGHVYSMSQLPLS
jgi:hypothetical protein